MRMLNLDMFENYLGQKREKISSFLTSHSFRNENYGARHGYEMFYKGNNNMQFCRCIVLIG